MCLIALALQAHERFPLVIAGNRDELLARPTAPLDVWRSSRGTTILGGRDGLDGGTWMGFTPQGRFAVLTNIRNPSAAAPLNPISRGSLVVSWLDSHLPAKPWAAQHNAAQFNGFNLIAGDWAAGTCTHLSSPQNFKENQPKTQKRCAQSAIELIVQEMPAHQVYGLSNATLNTPWPKTIRLTRALQSALDLPNSEQLMHSMLQALSDPDIAPDAQLPATGVSLQLERALSSVFVTYPADQPHYGTRSSWVAVLQTDGALQVCEVTHTHDGRPATARQHSLHWHL